MPSFFLQSNQQDAAVADRPKASELNDAEIEGMVTYLWTNSEPLSYAASNGGGNPGTGRELVHSVGCRGCHTDDPKEAFPHRADPRAFGPNLFGMGSKVNQEWLFDWLKNPKHYWAETNMPNLRLTDQEARDISAYLLSQRNAEFEKIQVPKVGNVARDWLTREYLSARMPLSAAEAKLKSMSDSEKKLFLGERMINKYGCFGCHQIKGFENTQPIGTELTEEGSKHVDRLDFGLEEDSVEKTLPAWVNAKLKDPRRFDRGKIKTWDEKLKMPNFYFNNQEITDLVTVIQGFSKTRMDTDMRWTLSGERPAIEAGRRVIRDHNCVGCHIVGKQGGAIRTTIQDPGYFPPILDGEGEKVIPFWLFSFLKEPSTIRPWMTVRMPTFGLKDHETTAISRMFAALDNAEYPFETEYYRLEPAAPEVTAAGAKLFTDFKCLQCHIAGSGKPERDAADLAPNLSLARSRLRPLWIEKWLRNPEALQPGTRMPSYFPDMKSPDPATLGGDAAQQIRALRYHILGLSSKMSPAAAAATTGE
jgi:mono/diheme cytochrome c family protein